MRPSAARWLLRARAILLPAPGRRYGLSRRAIDMHLFRRRRPARLPAAFRAIVEEAPDERLRGDARSDDSIRVASKITAQSREKTHFCDRHHSAGAAAPLVSCLLIVAQT